MLIFPGIYAVLWKISTFGAVKVMAAYMLMEKMHHLEAATHQT